MRQGNFCEGWHMRLLMAAAVIFGAVLQGGIATAQETASQPETFKDWELVCPAPKPTDKPRVCEIRTIILSDTGQRLGALVVAAQVGGGPDVIASALLPLGVDLSQQPSLAVGSGNPIELQYLRCLQRGCEAMTQLTAEQQAALRAGSSAKVAVGVGPGKKATFDFSLAGFSAAHDALKKKTGAQ